MIRQIKRIVYCCAKVLFSFFCLGALYLLLAFVLGLISVNNNFDPNQGTIEIFLVNNGAHVSIALPIKTEQKDWTTVFSPEYTQSPELSKIQPYVLVGWGSKIFYTQAYRWKDLQPKMAIQALFFDRGLLNIHFIDTPLNSPYIRSVKLTQAQYQKLIDGIERDLSLNKKGEPQPIDMHYQTTDIFYEANGAYTPWKTCNQWTRNQLSHAQVPTPLWAPFSQTLFWHLK